MYEVEPRVFLIGESRTNNDELESYLDHLGAREWSTNAPSDVEEIVEVMGRACYKSFGPGLNPNVTRVRPNNKAHLRNLIGTGHGSVLEHSWLNFMLCDVSRVVTHELVRHRAGTAISQESLRFVRLTDIPVWIPPWIRENAKGYSVFKEAVQNAEKAYHDLERIFMPDPDKMPFNEKKKITSALRRVAPIGLATNIGWSVNIRALRHIIEARTDPSAEEEIRLLFSKVADLAIERYPHVFGDYIAETVEGLPHYKTEHSKV